MDEMNLCVDLRNVYFDSEPDIPVVGGPLCRGYRAVLAGHIKEGRRMIQDFLTSVYWTRPHEQSTRRFVSQICRERNVSILGPEDEASRAIVFEAAGRRFDAFHYPLLENIRKTGYRPLQGPPITMLRGASHLFVVDGKNRTSIRAAMGETDVRNVVIKDAPVS